MDDAAVKESRRVLRLVQEHLSQAHLDLGVYQESVGLVDVTYHPDNKLPHLNYVSPRKKTAWVPGPEVEKGLDRLRELGRTPRVYYIEGLYPPLFAKSLRELGLIAEGEIAIMTYACASKSIEQPVLPGGIHFTEVNTQDGIAMWWYVWRNAYYDIITRSVEPIYIGRDMREIALGSQVNILLYRHNFPVGVVRLSLHQQVAHISALAIMKEVRSPEMLRLLYWVALKTAQEHRCELVFTSGESEADRSICREIGFLDSGSVVCYAEPPQQIFEESNAEHMAEPVFMLR